MLHVWFGRNGIAFQYTLAKQAHQIISQHNHQQRCFSGQEVPEIKAICAKITLQFLNAVLASARSRYKRQSSAAGKSISVTSALWR